LRCTISNTRGKKAKRYNKGKIRIISRILSTRPRRARVKIGRWHKVILSKTRIIELHAKVIAVDEGTVSYDTRVAFDKLDTKTLAEFKKFIEYIV